jgi:D-alanyl-D-alanine carboxypeptidase (penicillin-binding protein 5/6)
MEKETGTILFEENSHQKLEPASVTKVMTMLLIMEALDEGRIKKEDMVTTSTTAAGMGGSQVFLKEGEQMSVHDMLKAIAVASGNDASVAMAEHLAGSESGFVDLMNSKAAQLGMADTHFVNCTGLPAEGHVTSAHDIALMSRELILKHPGIQEYTTIWMDTLRNGQFQLANTNKLIYYYNGATGLKTGSTDTALYCLSACAQRDGMELIAVILGSPTSADRFETAKALLNYGFATYTLLDVKPSEAVPPVLVNLGEVSSVLPVPAKSSRILLEKTKANKVTTSISVTDSVNAPVEKGQKLGEMVVYVDDQPYETIPLIAEEAIPHLTFFQIFKDFMSILFLCQS